MQKFLLIITIVFLSNPAIADSYTITKNYRLLADGRYGKDPRTTKRAKKKRHYASRRNIEAKDDVSAKRTSRKSVVGPAIKGSIGIATGFEFVDSNPIVYGGDLIFPISDSVFIPLGFSRWSAGLKSEDEADPEVEISMYTIDTGLGFQSKVNGSFALLLGTRLGYSKLSAEYESVSFAVSGKNITPFVGFTAMVDRQVSLGFESRLPIFLANDQGEDDDSEESEDDEETNSSIPLYHMVSLSISL
jgi:hypothetical protein